MTTPMLVVCPGPYRGGLYRAAKIVVGDTDWAPQVGACFERGRTPVVAGGGTGRFRRAERALAAELDDAIRRCRTVDPDSEPGRLWLLGVSLVAGVEKGAGEAAAARLERWLVELYPAVGRMTDLAGRDRNDYQVAAAEARLILDGLRAAVDQAIVAERDTVPGDTNV